MKTKDKPYHCPICRTDMSRADARCHICNIIDETHNGLLREVLIRLQESQDESARCRSKIIDEDLRNIAKVIAGRRANMCKHWTTANREREFALEIIAELVALGDVRPFVCDNEDFIALTDIGYARALYFREQKRETDAAHEFFQMYSRGWRHGSRPVGKVDYGAARPALIAAYNRGWEDGNAARNKALAEEAKRLNYTPSILRGGDGEEK